EADVDVLDALVSDILEELFGVAEHVASSTAADMSVDAISRRPPLRLGVGSLPTITALLHERYVVRVSPERPVSARRSTSVNTADRRRTPRSPDVALPRGPREDASSHRRLRRCPRSSRRGPPPPWTRSPRVRACP